MCDINIKLFDAKTNRPPQSGNYLYICMSELYPGQICTIGKCSYSERWDKFNCQDVYEFEQVESLFIEPTYWAYMPEIKAN